MAAAVAWPRQSKRRRPISPSCSPLGIPAMPSFTTDGWIRTCTSWPSLTPCRMSRGRCVRSSTPAVARRAWLACSVSTRRRRNDGSPLRPAAAPLPAKDACRRLCSGGARRLVEHLGGDPMSFDGGGNSAVHGDEQQDLAHLLGRAAAGDRSFDVHAKLLRPVQG